MYTIEVCGLPAVGKSTTLSLLSEKLKYVNLNISKCKLNVDKLSLEEKKFYLFVTKSFQYATGEKIKIRHNHTIRSFTQQLYNKRLDDENNIGIIDGGLIHRGSTIKLACLDIDLEDYYSLMPLPNLIVYLYNDIHKIRYRNFKKGGAHDRSEDIIRRFNVYDLALSILIKRDVDIIMLPTDTTPEITSSKLKTLIQEKEAAYHAKHFV